MDLDSETVLVPTAGEESPRVVLIRDRLREFTWSWFSVTMSTGSLAVLLFMTPNKFPGLTTIGSIVFVLDLVLFLVFVGLIVARFILIPSSLYGSLHNNHEALFFGGFWVSLALILQNAELYGQPHCGPWLTKTLEICFWSYAATVFLVSIFQYYTLFHEQKLPVGNMMPVWILPIYPFVVAGPLAGILLGSRNPADSFAMLVGGIMFQGLGWIVAHFMYPIYIIRLISGELPEPHMRGGMYISVGPVCEF
jgi:tellurite resistance protein TehA-like permease